VVYLVLTRAGFDEVQSKLQPSDVVWAGRSVLSTREIDALRARGFELSVFDHDADPADSGAVAGWTFTVAQHHPHQPIWVESKDEAVEGRRNQRRSLQLWIIVVVLIISAAYSALGAVAAWRGKELSESTGMLWLFVFSVSVTLWSRNDERYPVTRSRGDYSYLLMFFFWPVVLLNHAVRSRGVEGLVLYLGFLGVYFAPYFVQMAVWVSRML
jgi:hypothetical protein